MNLKQKKKEETPHIFLKQQKTNYYNTKPVIKNATD